MNTQSNSSKAPSGKELEAAAMVRLAEMVKDDQGKKPSMEAMEIAVRLLAAKAKAKSEQSKAPTPKE